MKYRYCYKQQFKEIWYDTPKEYFRAIRQEVIRILGGKCAKCGFGDWRALQVDHVNGCGNDFRLPQLMLYKDIRRCLITGETKYQLLCSNCNSIKKYENNENPYQTRVSADLSSGDSVHSVNTNS